jgi:hypothetical protein
MAADDIQYAKSDGVSIQTHPLCPNTYRDGRKIGDEPAATAIDDAAQEPNAG